MACGQQLGSSIKCKTTCLVLVGVGAVGRVPQAGWCLASLPLCLPPWFSMCPTLPSCHAELGGEGDGPKQLLQDNSQALMGLNFYGWVEAAYVITLGLRQLSAACVPTQGLFVSAWCPGEASNGIHGCLSRPKHHPRSCLRLPFLASKAPVHC